MRRTCPAHLACAFSIGECIVWARWHERGSLCLDFVSTACGDRLYGGGLAALHVCFTYTYQRQLFISVLTLLVWASQMRMARNDGLFPFIPRSHILILLITNCNSMASGTSNRPAVCISIVCINCPNTFSETSIIKLRTLILGPCSVRHALPRQIS